MLKQAADHKYNLRRPTWPPCCRMLESTLDGEPAARFEEPAADPVAQTSSTAGLVERT